MRQLIVLMALMLVGGCTTVPVFQEWDAPAGGSIDVAWRTESRQQWYWGVRPVWKAPVDVYFRTAGACEAFRAAHPTYTRADEVCQPVTGIWSSWPTWK